MRSVKEFQKKTCSILDGSEFSRLSKFIEFFIVTIVILNVLVIILESVPEINSVYSDSFYVFELFSVGIFTLEYILRVWSYGVKYKKTEGKCRFLAAEARGNLKNTKKIQVSGGRGSRKLFKSIRKMLVFCPEC